MASRRLFVLLTAGLLTAAACGGSAAQRAALKVQSQNAGAQAGGAAAPAGGYSSGDTGAAAAPADAGSAGASAATPSAGGSAGLSSSGGSNAASPAAGASPAAKSNSPAAASASGSASRSASGSNGPVGNSAAGQASTPGAPTPGGPTPGGPAVGGATDVGVTASSIKVGHIGIYSGPVGSFGNNLSYAGRATLQEINDNGGINGRKLDVLVRDDAWDGTKGMNAARDLVEREHIFAFCCIMSLDSSSRSAYTCVRAAAARLPISLMRELSSPRSRSLKKPCDTKSTVFGPSTGFSDVSTSRSPLSVPSPDCRTSDATASASLRISSLHA